jgi:histidyl-tRNA synthetase
VAIIAGQREFDAGKCQVKDLATTQSTEASLTDPDQLIAAIRKSLGPQA